MSLIVVEDTISGDVYSREMEHPAGKIVAVSVWQNGFLTIGATVVELSETKVRVVVQNNVPAQVRLVIDHEEKERKTPVRRRRTNGKQ